jgi:tetratricopeptide (TPR) repeat protein
MLVDQQAFDELPKFLNSLRFFFHVRNRWQEGVELFETAANALQSFPRSNASELALARLWARLAWFYSFIGFWEKGKVTAEAAIRLLDRHDSPEDLLVAYRNLALIAMLLKDGETQRRMAEAGYALARKLGSRGHEAYCLIQLNFAAIRLNDDVDVAMRSVRQARAIFEDLGDQWGLMVSYLSEAGIAFQVGDYEQAKQWLLQGLAGAQAFGTTYYIASIVLYLGVVTLHQEDYGQAWDLLSQSLRAFWDAGYTHFAHAPLIRMAQLLLRADKAESAVEILALRDRYPGYHGHGALFEINADGVEKFRRELEARLGSDRFAAAWAHGRGRELSAVVAELLYEDIDE